MKIQITSELLMRKIFNFLIPFLLITNVSAGKPQENIADKLNKKYS